MDAASWISTLWPQAGEMIGGRQSARPRPDHQHAPAARRCRGLNDQPSCVARSPRKRSTAWDADRRVQRAAIAGAFARMVADPGRAPPASGLSRTSVSTLSRYFPAWASPSQPGYPRPAGRRCCRGARGRHRPDGRFASARFRARPVKSTSGLISRMRSVHAGAFAVWIIGRAARLALPVSRRKESHHDRQHDARDAKGIGVAGTRFSVSLPPPARSFSSQP